MASNSTDNDVKALRAELETLRKDFARIAETLEQTVRHGGEEAVHRAQRSANWARGEARKAVHGVIEEIEEKPIASILSVFAVGVVLGLLFSGRR